MKQIKKEQSIELRKGKIVKVSVDEIEIEESEIEGEINMCVRRITESQDMIESETQKLEMLKNIKKTIK